MHCAFFQDPISPWIFSWLYQLRLYHQRWQRREADKTKFSFFSASECASAIARYAADSASVANSALNLNFCAARINCLISHKLLPSNQHKAGCNLCWMHKLIFSCFILLITWLHIFKVAFSNDTYCRSKSSVGEFWIILLARCGMYI